MKIASTKTILTAIAILFVLLGAVVCFVAYRHHRAPSAQTSEHTWTTFKNSTLGISLAYPSDMLTPEQGADTATTSISFIVKGATTPNAYAIRIGTEATDAKNIAEYFAMPGIQTPVPPTSLVIGGLPAMELDEMAYADYQVYLIHNGKLYVITINLPSADAEHIKSSIVFDLEHI